MTNRDSLAALEDFRFPLADGSLLDQAILRQSTDDCDVGSSPNRTAEVMRTYRRFLVLAADAPGGMLTVSAPLASLHEVYFAKAKRPGALDDLLGTSVTLRRARRLPLRDAAYQDSLARYRAAYDEDPHPRIAPSPTRRIVTGLLRLAFLSGFLGGIVTVVAKPEAPTILIACLGTLAVGAISVIGFDQWTIRAPIDRPRPWPEDRPLHPPLR